MGWHAKLRGAYTTTTPEFYDNLVEIYGVFNAYGYSLESVCGIGGNIGGESGLNPWRWEGDTVNYNRGYGLFQFTPARDYIDTMTTVPYYSPNLDVNTQTPTATPEDGYAQCEVVAEDYLQKWVSSCWRSYWNKNDYPELWDMRTHILRTYGNGTTLTQSQFASIDYVEYAAFAFLACYEGPTIPNYNVRKLLAQACYRLLEGVDPPTPPPFKRTNKSHVWLFLKYGI